MTLSKIREHRKLGKVFLTGICLTAAGVITVLSVFIPSVAQNADLPEGGADVGSIIVRVLAGLVLAVVGFAVMAAVFWAADKSAWMVEMNSDAANETPARPPVPDDFFTNGEGGRRSTETQSKT